MENVIKEKRYTTPEERSIHKLYNKIQDMMEDSKDGLFAVIVNLESMQRQEEQRKKWFD